MGDCTPAKTVGCVAETVAVAIAVQPKELVAVTLNDIRPAALGVNRNVRGCGLVGALTNDPAEFHDQLPPVRLGVAVIVIAVPTHTVEEATEIEAVKVAVHTAGGKLPGIVLLNPGALGSLSVKELVELTHVVAFNLAFEAGESAKPYWLISIQTDTIAQKEV